MRPVPCINYTFASCRVVMYIAPVVGRCQLALEYNYSRISLLCTTKFMLIHLHSQNALKPVHANKRQTRAAGGKSSRPN